MIITVKQAIGSEFGTTGNPVTETKVFRSIVEYNEFISTLKSFDAENEIVSVHWDCK